MTWSNVTAASTPFIRPRPAVNSDGGIDFVLRVQNNPGWQVRTEQPWKIRTAPSAPATSKWSNVDSTAERFIRQQPFEDGTGGIDFVMQVQTNPGWEIRTTQPWQIRTLSSITADTDIEGQP